MTLFITLTTLCLCTNGFIATKNELSDISAPLHLDMAPDDYSPTENPVDDLTTSTTAARGTKQLYGNLSNARRFHIFGILRGAILAYDIYKLAQEISSDQELHKMRGFDFCEAEMKKFKLWQGGVIPYYIDRISFSGLGARQKIKAFLEAVNYITKLKFVELSSPPYDDQTRWVLFLNRRGLQDCADHSITKFTNQGVQRVVLGYECMNTGGELAEAVLAIAGVPPQHNAPDRDQYIQVNVDNIMPDKTDLFRKLSNSEWLFHDVAYDYSSAGHYHAHKYSSNGRATIEVKSGNFSVVENSLLSYSDIQKLNMLYRYITSKNENEKQICQEIFKKNRNHDKILSMYDVELSAKVENKPLQKPKKYLDAIGSSEKDNQVTMDENEDNYNDGTEKNGVVVEESPNERNNVMKLNSRDRSIYEAMNADQQGWMDYYYEFPYNYRSEYG